MIGVASTLAALTLCFSPLPSHSSLISFTAIAEQRSVSVDQPPCFIPIVHSLSSSSTSRHPTESHLPSSIAFSAVSPVPPLSSTAFPSTHPMARPFANSRELPIDLIDCQPPLKRTRLQYRKAAEAAATALLHIRTSLAPVRFAFFDFITEDDAARMVRVSPAFTSAVLGGYAFTEQVFTIRGRGQLRRLVTLYKRYGLSITRMQTTAKFNASLVDVKGRSLLPSSLIALALGYTRTSVMWDSMFLNAEEYQRCDRSWEVLETEERRDEMKAMLEECDWANYSSVGHSTLHSSQAPSLPVSASFTSAPPSIGLYRLTLSPPICPSFDLGGRLIRS